MKERIKKWGMFIAKNWYASMLTVLCFVMYAELLGTWAGVAAIFLTALVLVLRYIFKK
jgi:hypothetical protein